MRLDVQVTGGAVRGVLEAGVATFRGIPFASLPGQLAAPHPVTPWHGVREATTFGPPPPQTGVDPRAHEELAWLTVNVWSRDPGGSAGLPVMVWVHAAHT